MNIKKQLGIKELPEPFKKLYDKLVIDPNNLNGFYFENQDKYLVEDIFEVNVEDQEILKYFTENLIHFSSMHYVDFLFWVQKDIPVMRLPIIRYEGNGGFIKIEALNFVDFIQLIITDDFLYEWENEKDIAEFRKQVEKIAGILPFIKEEKEARKTKILETQIVFNNWLIKNSAPQFVLSSKNYGYRADEFEKDLKNKNNGKQNLPI